MRYLFLVTIMLALASCGTNKYLTSSAKSNEIENISYFTPLTYIQYIEKGNKTVLSRLFVCHIQI